MKSIRAFAVCFCIAILVQAGLSQVKERQLKVRNSYTNPPVRVETILVKSDSFDGRGRIQAEDDWLRNLSIQVRNISTKNITVIRVKLWLEKTGEMPAAVLLPVYFSPGLVSDPQMPDIKKRAVLEPGAATVLKVDNSDYTRAVETLGKFHVTSIQDITVDVRQVSFEDGTQWSLGFETKNSKLPPPILEKPVSPLLFFLIQRQDSR